MKRHGILGGSFDPIHEGHVRAAETALAARGLASVLLVVASVPPHKRGTVASFEDRVAMARLAIGERTDLEVCTLEGERPGPSFTVDTVEELRRRRPGAAWELLVGADMLADLPNWHRAADLVAMVTVAGFVRPGEDLGAAAATFEARFGRERLVRVDLEPVPVSSTAVREGLARGERQIPGLSPEVHRYIEVKRLYRGGIWG